MKAFTVLNSLIQIKPAGLENSTRPLVFTSVSGCRASEYFDISTENLIFPMYANKFCDAGQVPIFRYFEACSPLFVGPDLGPSYLQKDYQQATLLSK